MTTCLVTMFAWEENVLLAHFVAPLRVSQSGLPRFGVTQGLLLISQERDVLASVLGRGVIRGQATRECDGTHLLYD